MSALRLSTSSEEARRAYLEGEARLLAARPSPEKSFEKAIAADPDFALAHAGEARALFLTARVPQAKAAALMARELAKNLPAREKNNVEVVALTIEGGAAKAYQLAREHLRQYPTDAMVLAPCTGVFGLVGFSGRKGREQEMRDLLEELAPHWSEDSFFLTQLAFARCETGAIDAARRAIERALELDPASGHGAHVKAHVLYEAGEHAAGLKFVQGWLPGYAREGLMHCHLSWHLALLQQELGEHDAALKTYLKGVHPGGSWGPPINVLTDGASFLWRAELAGRPRDAERWHEIKQYGDKNFPAAGIAFADVHKALAYAATGDEVALEKLLGELRAREQAGKLLAGPIVPALAEGFDAFARKDYAKAVALLEPYMAEHERIGGSRAQRKLIELTLDAARNRTTR
ncbi:MAG TPA: tetratricopeptide repeat protein [Burkholderiales bacterium]